VKLQVTPMPLHYVSKHLQQGIESDHFRVKESMPRIGGFQSFYTARRTIQGFEAMLWLRKSFGFACAWTVREQNRLLGNASDFKQITKSEDELIWLNLRLRRSLRQARREHIRRACRDSGSGAFNTQ
jgi:hypothetical protein